MPCRLERSGRMPRAMDVAARDLTSRLDGEIRFADGRAVAWRELAPQPRHRRASCWPRGERDVALAVAAPRGGPRDASSCAVARDRSCASAWSAGAGRPPRRCARCSTKALLGCKPGLVGPGDSGARGDMSLATFYRSIAFAAILFPAIAALGAAGAPWPIAARAGLERRRPQCCATGGVNTHPRRDLPPGPAVRGRGRALLTARARAMRRGRARSAPVRTAYGLETPGRVHRTAVQSRRATARRGTRLTKPPAVPLGAAVVAARAFAVQSRART